MFRESSVFTDKSDLNGQLNLSEFEFFELYCVWFSATWVKLAVAQ